MGKERYFLRLCEVLKICGISRSSCYALMKAGKFPKNVKITDRSVRWISEEIFGWVEGRINTRSIDWKLFWYSTKERKNKMPLEKLIFPHLYAKCPCIVCVSSRIFEFHQDVIKIMKYPHEYITMYSRDGNTIIGEARVHCTYLKRQVQFVNYLQQCPFFDDGNNAMSNPAD